MAQPEVPIPKLIPESGTGFNDLTALMPVSDHVSKQLHLDNSSVYRVFLATRVLVCLHNDIDSFEQATMIVYGIHNLAENNCRLLDDNLSRVSKLFGDLDVVDVYNAVDSFKKPANQEAAIIVYIGNILLGIESGERTDKSQIDEFDARVRHAGLIIDIVAQPKELREEKARELGMNLSDVRDELVKIGLTEEEADLSMRQGDLVSNNTPGSLKNETSIERTQATVMAINEQRKQMKPTTASQLFAEFEGASGLFDEPIDEIIAEIEKINKIWEDIGVFSRNNLGVNKIKEKIAAVLSSDPVPDCQSMHRLTRAANAVRLIHSSYYINHQDQIMSIAEALDLLGLAFSYYGIHHKHQPLIAEAFALYLDEAGVPYFTNREQQFFIRKYMEKFREIMERPSVRE